MGSRLVEHDGLGALVQQGADIGGVGLERAIVITVVIGTRVQLQPAVCPCLHRGDPILPAELGEMYLEVTSVAIAARMLPPNSQRRTTEVLIVEYPADDYRSVRPSIDSFSSCRRARGAGLHTG